MGTTMTVELQLFARLRELCGNHSQLSLQVPSGATARDCFVLLCEQFEAVRAYEDAVAVAVNEEFAAWDQVIEGGDSLAFIPPVSGG
jgi:molybdopterin converting factor subunit 1